MHQLHYIWYNAENDIMQTMTCIYILCIIKEVNDTCGYITSYILRYNRYMCTVWKPTVLTKYLMSDNWLCWAYRQSYLGPSYCSSLGSGLYFWVFIVCISSRLVDSSHVLFTERKNSVFWKTRSCCITCCYSISIDE